MMLYERPAAVADYVASAEARWLIEIHGDDAIVIAERAVDTKLNAGDTDGALRKDQVRRQVVTMLMR